MESTLTYLERLASVIGAEIYVVGGCVRDHLLGSPSSDFDLLARGVPQDELIVRLSKLGRVDKTGAVFGVIRFYPQAHPESFEISLPRKEVSLGFGHKDFSIEFDHKLSVEEDLFRRDFTVNAMAIGVHDRELLDPVGGRADLNAGILRVLHDSSAHEDPLRILRAVRFIAKLGFDVCPETDIQLRDAVPLLAHVSHERLQMELLKAVLGPDIDKALRYAREIGALKQVLPELDACHGVEQNEHHAFDVFEHTVRVVKHTITDDPYVKLGALFHDVGKPPTRWKNAKTGRYHFYDPEPGTEFAEEPQIKGAHEVVGARMAHDIMQRLRFSSQHCDRVSKFVLEHMFVQGDNLRRPSARKLLNKFAHTPGGLEENIDGLFAIRNGDVMGGKISKTTDEYLAMNARFYKLVKEEIAKETAFRVTDLVVNGHDAMAAGLAGPAIGHALKQLLDEVIEDPSLNNRGILLARLDNIAEM